MKISYLGHMIQYRVIILYLNNVFNIITGIIVIVIVIDKNINNINNSIGIIGLLKTSLPMTLSLNVFIKYCVFVLRRRFLYRRQAKILPRKE